jgi:hypothetical protein
MIKKVLKFGGTSVGTTERIQHVANIIKKEHLQEIKLLLLFQQWQEKLMNLLIFQKKFLKNLIKEN